MVLSARTPPVDAPMTMIGTDVMDEVIQSGANDDA
jgi:hypothetical protein